MMNPFKIVRSVYTDLKQRSDLELATFAGGCFWCMEGPFEAMEGVEEAVLGYVGGTKEDPTYREVASGKTDHREGVQVFYDPEIVSFRNLLNTYWWQVDPTDGGGQFADRGHQYKTAVYYHTEEQQKEVWRQIKKLSASERYEKPIRTEVLPYSTFYPAEDYHQQFYQKQQAYYQRYKKGSGRASYIEAMQVKNDAV